MKTVTISVINDLVTDQRLHRFAGTLYNEGFEVKLIGRKLTNKLPENKLDYSVRRFRMLFRKGPMFYLFFNLRLFFLLLFSKRPELLISIDLDTLLANFLISKIKHIPLLYDSHEYFTEVPELVNRKFVRNIWEKLERSIVPRIKYACTVSESIAEAYQQKYGVDFICIRNVPYSRESIQAPKNQDKKTGGKTIIYQGALNIGRGIELMIQSMQYLDDIVLLIAGDGDIRTELQGMADKLSLNTKVRFLGRLAPSELFNITSDCMLGLSLEEDLGLSYRYSLPNKIFDYVQARIPVLCSDLPEMSSLVREFDIGDICKIREAKALAEQINKNVDNSQLNESLKKRLNIAAGELCWEKEEQELIKLINLATI